MPPTAPGGGGGGLGGGDGGVGQTPGMAVPVERTLPVVLSMGGTGPHKAELLLSCSLVRAERALQSVGTVPVSRLYPRLRRWRRVSALHSGGSRPVALLVSTPRLVRAVSADHEEGREPPRLFEPSWRLVRPRTYLHVRDGRGDEM